MHPDSHTHIYIVSTSRNADAWGIFEALRIGLIVALVVHRAVQDNTPTGLCQAGRPLLEGHAVTFGVLFAFVDVRLSGVRFHARFAVLHDVKFFLGQIIGDGHVCGALVRDAVCVCGAMR